MMPIRLLIVQPYVPSYRVAFFRDLRHALEALNVQLTVAAGLPTGDLALRGDSSLDEVDIRLHSSSLTLGSRRLNLRHIGDTVRHVQPRFIIAEQAIKNLEIYRLLARQTLGGARVGLWGQGRSYSTQQSPVEANLKQWVTRRADWFFAYTDSGAQHVIAHGYPADRVTVINNTIDTRELLAELKAVSDDDVSAFRQRHHLVGGRTALFMGGIDDSKGIDFLLACALEISQRMEGFVLMIAGDGVRRRDIERMEADGAPIRYVGRVEGRDKALALKAADLLMIPEWVGLVAVDGLVAGRPVAATDWPSHSPEFDYLTHGRNAWIATHSTVAYSQAIIEVLERPGLLRQLQEDGRRDGHRLTIESMVKRFVSGVASWTNSRNRT